MDKNHQISVAGGDTDAPLNLDKRLRVVEPHLVPGNSRVLDCGCGRGEYVVALRERFNVDAYGVEYLQEKVDDFHEAHPDVDWVVRGDIEQLGFADDEFDIALLNEVLEHVPNELAALGEIRRVLHEDGKLILYSPNRLFPFESHGVYWRDTDKIVPPWVPFIPYLPVPLGRTIFRYWARNYWPRSLRRLVEEAGFEVMSTTYLWQTFENISGAQGFLIRVTRPILRALSVLLEKIPGIRGFGISQVLVARKRP